MLTTRQVRSGSTVTVELFGDFIRADSEVASRAFEWATLDAELIDGQGAHVIIELRGVTSIDPNGVGLLVRLRDALRGLPATMVVVGVSPGLSKVFRSVHLAERLDFQEPFA